MLKRNEHETFEGGEPKLRPKTIVTKTKNVLELLVEETQHISNDKPDLNIHVSSV